MPSLVRYRRPRTIGRARTGATRRRGPARQRLPGYGSAVSDRCAGTGPVRSGRRADRRRDTRPTGPAIELGSVVLGGGPHPDAQVRVPLAMLNRHGLIAGATGTGKTKTLQLIAEQLSAAGRARGARRPQGRPGRSGAARRGRRPDHPAGRATPATTGRRPASRSSSSPSAAWAPAYRCARRSPTSARSCCRRCSTSTPPRRARSALVFHYADEAGLPLLDLKDLRAVLSWLTSDEGKADLEGLGGLSPATAGVILRELIAPGGPRRRRLLRRARVGAGRPAAARRPTAAG